MVLNYLTMTYILQSHLSSELFKIWQQLLSDVDFIGPKCWDEFERF